MASFSANTKTVFLIYPGVAALDVAGPAQALAVAGDHLAFVSVGGGLIQTDCPGLRLDSAPVSAIRAARTLIVPGGAGAFRAARDAALIAETIRLARAGARVASVCVGAFILAAAGLLSGHRATTHWRACAALARRHPDIRVEPDRIWVRDGTVWSSAGVSAGIDLALALIEQDHGATRALHVAKELVVFLKRPGGQAQFSTALAGQIAAGSGRIGPLLAWMADHLADDLRVERLADRAGMSERTFARAFFAETGETPARFVEAMRVEAARQAIETTREPPGQVARRCGFGDAQRMRRAIRRATGATPSELRDRFGIATARQPPSSGARRAGQPRRVAAE